MAAFCDKPAPAACRDKPAPAAGRELYHWLGFETAENSHNTATAAVVGNLPRKPFQRPFVILQVVGCVAVAVSTARQLGPAISLASIFTTYFAFDLYSGLVHYCLDWEGFNSLPFFGPLCRTFQHHHKDTTFIWRSDVYTNLSEVGLFLHISDTLPLVALSWSGAMRVPAIVWYCSAWKTLHSMIGELAHRAAHKPPSVRSGLERALQRSGIYLDPKYHLQGHHHNLDEQFCELGWMDAVFDGMRRWMTPNRWFWAAVTVCASFVDTWVLSWATMAAVRALGTSASAPIA